MVQLIETCEPVKRKNLLHLVATEDPGWAHLLAKKVLSVDRVFTWSDDVLSDILKEAPVSLLATLYKNLPDQARVKMISCLSSKVSRQLTDQVDEMKKKQTSATSDEYATAVIQFIQMIRQLEADGILNFQSIDPTLVIDPKIAA